VVNCTGLRSLKLGGVEDTKLYPGRGQIVVVRNDPKVMTSISGTDDGSDEATYIMHRAAGRFLP
jgi:D-amino-acid oxidase